MDGGRQKGEKTQMQMSQKGEGSVEVETNAVRGDQWEHNGYQCWSREQCDNGNHQGRGEQHTDPGPVEGGETVFEMFVIQVDGEGIKKWEDPEKIRRKERDEEEDRRGQLPKIEKFNVLPFGL